MREGMGIKGAIIGAATAAAFAIGGCGGDANADPCEELEQLTADNPDGLAADAEDPDGLFAQCIDQLAEQWNEMSPEEQKAFLNR